MTENPMTVKDLASLYNISCATMGTILCRVDFIPFFLGKYARQRGSKKVAAVWYNCNSEFHKTMKKHLAKIKTRKKQKS